MGPFSASTLLIGLVLSFGAVD